MIQKSRLFLKKLKNNTINLNQLIQEIIDEIKRNQEQDSNKTPTLSNISKAFSSKFGQFYVRNSEEIRDKVIQCLTKSREQKQDIETIVIEILKFIATLK